MSSLAVLRTGRLGPGGLASSSYALPCLSRIGQTRSAGVVSKKPSNDEKKKVAGHYRKSTTAQKKDEKFHLPPDKRVGSFKPISVNMLPAEVFESDKRTTLHLPAFHPEVLTQEAISKAMTFPAGPNDAINAYGLPKNMLVEYRVLSKPCSVVRDVTIKIVDTLDASSLTPSKETRLVLTGNNGCGKSHLLLQAVEYCTMKDWIVLYIPRAINTVNSTTAYVYDPTTQTYHQPAFSQQLLKRFLSVNLTVLQAMVTQEASHIESRTVPARTPLPSMIQMGIDDSHLAPFVLSALMNELSRQSKHPVLLAVDDFQALYSTTLYRDPHFKPLMSHSLSVPRLLLEFASGIRSFARGAVVGALSTSDTQFRLPLELREALGLPEFRFAGPYVHRNRAFVEYAKGLRNFPVPDQLSVNEAASVYEVWQQDKALHSSYNDETFMSKYTEAGGNARNFVWKGLLATTAL
ncbi:28S ribosomal protein S29, mitochondrial [Grifola frondosa]|uniref:Small ribosomal subunit protein mS29 n=1 Tax=Grifola frondosa TaxID=5627 RepID=A0A1C7LQE8_GRIFR|nr:28S ribosomal protein S29, mitochondrial [Grifola frondosa]